MSKELLVKAADEALAKGGNVVKCTLVARTETIDGETVITEDEKDVEFTPEAIYTMAMHADKNITIQGRKLKLIDGEKQSKDKLKPSKDKPKVVESEQETAAKDGGDGPDKPGI